MSVASKLQVKPGQSVAVLHAPGDVDLGIDAVATDPTSADAVIVFATNRSELEARLAPAVDAARRDALAWVAYPKAGQLGTDLNRDSLAAIVAEHDVRPVRQVAIDALWSALRFRPA